MKTSKKMTNLQIAELLRDVAAAYQLKDANKYKFQVIAYQRAADSVEHATSELQDLWEEKKLDDVPGLGKSLQEHLDEIFRTGKSKHFEELTKDIPKMVFELMKIPGIGVKTSMKLVKELKIKNLDELKRAISESKVAKLEGFGVDSQERISKALKEYEKKAPARMLLPYASQIASKILEWLKEDKNIEIMNTLGSLRRQVSTIGDIDFAVASKDPNYSLTHFTKYPKATRILEKGDRTASILLAGNIRVDLMAG